jgi:hypothetical protein
LHADSIAGGTGGGTVPTSSGSPIDGGVGAAGAPRGPSVSRQQPTVVAERGGRYGNAEDAADLLRVALRPPATPSWRGVTTRGAAGAVVGNPRDRTRSGEGAQPRSAWSSARSDGCGAVVTGHGRRLGGETGAAAATPKIAGADPVPTRPVRRETVTVRGRG